MASFNPLRAVGTVYRGVEHASATFLGSCFALRSSTAVLTAAHCIGDLSAEDLSVRMPHVIVLGETGAAQPSGILVDEVVRHSNADVALLRLRTQEWSIEPFWNALPIHGVGEDVMAYGYPEDVRSEDREPIARLFRGYVQRAFAYESFLGYAYTALELDFACPAGLSGGPVFRPTAPQMVLGIATENFESTTFLEALEETHRDGSIVRTQYQRVLSYGVALYLDVISEWLDNELPAFDAVAWSARRRNG